MVIFYLLGFEHCCFQRKGNCTPFFHKNALQLSLLEIKRKETFRNGALSLETPLNPPKYKIKGFPSKYDKGFSLEVRNHK